MKTIVILKKTVLLAAITSVAMGSFGLLPVLVFIHASPITAVSTGTVFSTKVNSAVSILLIVLFFFLLWIINIVLFGLFERSNVNYKKRNIARYVTSYAVVLVLLFIYFLFLKDSVLSLTNRFIFYPFLAAISNNTIVIIILDLTLLREQKSRIELEYSNLKVNNLIAEQNYLKQQLQPHFLFNSLTTLKSLIKRRPVEAEDYLVRLSNLLRTSLGANTRNAIALRDELQLCIDYMEMQKIRFKNCFFYIVEIPENIIEAASVPVFSIQLLIENAIKHNILTEEHPLTITISHSNSGYLMIKNNKLPHKKMESTPAIGLKNLSERYRLIGGSDIKIHDSDMEFAVEIKALYL